MPMFRALQSNVARLLAAVDVRYLDAPGLAHEFAQAARRVSREKKTPLVDNYAQWQKAGSAVVDSWLTDGCHPNQTGHEILAKAIIDVLLPLLGGTARADCSLRSE